MLGLHRQFVFAPESCARLPELALLMANILTYPGLSYPRCQLASGIDTQKHLAVCVGSYQASFFPKDALSDPNFAKRRRFDPL